MDIGPPQCDAMAERAAPWRVGRRPGAAMRASKFFAVAGLTLLLGLTLAACAGGGEPRGRGFGLDDDGRGGPGRDDEDGRPRPPRQQLFVSPSGQPFRTPMGQPYPSADWFAQADADHDGKLTRAEFRADAEAWFAKLDRDHDGQISMPEVTVWEEQTVPEITTATLGGFGGGRGGPLSRNKVDTRAQGAAAYSLVNEPHPIRGADADFSMNVSKAEWRAAADRRFDLLDQTKLGYLTPDTLPKTPVQAMMAERGKHPGRDRQAPPPR